MDTILVQDVQMNERIRSEMGDIDALASSIKEFGLIQPIVVAIDGTKPVLVAGGRRLTAIKRLGWTELQHGRDYIWRSEEDALRRKSVEIEENLRRKELTWQEQVVGKQQLLALMQTIHGAPTQGGGLTREQRASGLGTGFGVNKLATMLGESAASASRDLTIATAIAKVPILANEPTKEAAYRKLTAILTAALGGQTAATQAQAQRQLSYRVLIMCDSEQHQVELITRFEAEGLKCQPVIV